MSIETIRIFGKKSLKLTTGRYEAVVVTDYGCNVISLFDKELQIPILKLPLENDSDEFLSAPQHFGNAVLFPPNRIDNGSYSKNGKTYSFPINVPSKKENQHYMYSHGILRFMVFEIDSCVEKDGVITLAASYHSKNGGRIFADFPHEFICRMEFVLSDAGLTETIRFDNLSDSPMPLGVGFHTAFMIPWDERSKRDDYRIVLGAGEHIILDDLHLATGGRKPLSSAYRTEGILPFEPIVDEHTSALALNLDKKSFHGAIIKNICTKHNIYFETSENFGYWMVWNNQAKSNYVCVEPMSWIINAPNIPLADEQTGYTQIEPGESWTGTLSFLTE